MIRDTCKHKKCCKNSKLKGNCYTWDLKSTSTCCISSALKTILSFWALGFALPFIKGCYACRFPPFSTVFSALFKKLKAEGRESGRRERERTKMPAPEAGGMGRERASGRVWGKLLTLAVVNTNCWRLLYNDCNSITSNLVYEKKKL